MKFKTKMLVLCCIPLICFGIATMMIGLVQFRSGMYERTKESLKSSAIAAMNLYDNQGYGNYAKKDDGNVWRGMNFNVSGETSLVDSLKEQTGVDITFFYEDTAVMTSVCNDDGQRWIGMKAGDNIKNYTLAKGAQLWYRNIEIDGKMCHAYLIPITQPDDGSVVGAMMASTTADGLNGIIRQYIFSTVIAACVMLLLVIVGMFWYIGGLTRVLHDVKRVLFKVANGDLEDSRLTKQKKRQDEFGDLMDSTERLRIKMKTILNEIQEGTNQLTQDVEKLKRTSVDTGSAAREMSNSVDAIMKTAGDQRDNTNSAAGSVEKTTYAIDEILSQINEMNQVSAEMAEKAQKSCDILGQLLLSSRDAQDIVQEICRQTEETNASVQQIQNVTEYITNIADETNLLSLNASIEAARAGDAGKGFAVVAQEISQLADESNRSVVQIGQNIEELVERTQGIVSAMQKVEDSLKLQEENVVQTKEIFDSLNGNIMVVTDKERDMQDNVTVMDGAKDHLATVIDELSTSAQSNADTSENAQRYTQEMTETIGGMQQLTDSLTELAGRLNKTIQDFLS